MSKGPGDLNLELVDEAYETKMAGFEVDCADGKGEGSACHYVADFYSAVKEEYGRAASLYARNCKEKNYAPSCFSLGRFLIVGKGGEHNDQKALELFDKGCKAGLLPSCYFQALLLFTGLKPPGSIVDPDMFNSAVKGDVGKRIANAVKAVKAEPVRTPAEEVQHQKNKELALKIFDKACNEGSSDSCYFLGSQYLKQDNPKRDPAKAVPCLKRSCEANHAPSCFNLAVLYNKGDTGVPADSAQFEIYKKRAQELADLMGGMGGLRTN